MPPHQRITHQGDDVTGDDLRQACELNVSVIPWLTHSVIVVVIQAAEWKPTFCQRNAMNRDFQLQRRMAFLYSTSD